MAVPGPVRRRLAAYSVDIHNDESIVGTRVIPASMTTETKRLAIFHLEFEELRHAPEGQWDTGDIKMYEVGAATIVAESVVTFASAKYRVLRISDRNKDGGFTMYWAKLIGENEASDE